MKKFVKESLAMAEPAIKPAIKPKTKPNTQPGRPSPIRRDKPAITPKPKASADDVANKFLKLIEEK